MQSAEPNMCTARLKGALTYGIAKYYSQQQMKAKVGRPEHAGGRDCSVSGDATAGTSRVEHAGVPGQAPTERVGYNGRDRRLFRGNSASKS